MQLRTGHIRHLLLRVFGGTKISRCCERFWVLEVNAMIAILHWIRKATVTLELVALGLVSPVEAGQEIDVKQESIEVTRRAYAMGTWFNLTAYAHTEATAMQATESALLAVTRVETRLSTWSADSQLSRLNQSPPSTWVPLSPELAGDLHEAVLWWQQTEGAFHPGIASLMRVWGVREGGRIPAAGELQDALTGIDMGHLQLEANRARRLDRRFAIEEGGFAKGIGLREAAEAALAAGAECIELNLGGQIHRAGRCDETELALAHPRHRDQVIAFLSLAIGSVATSGNGIRGFVIDGQEMGHILDPSSGRPTRAWGSVTAVTPDPVAADCLATALYVMGLDSARAWLARNPGVEAVILVHSENGGKLWTTPGLSVQINPAWPSVQIKSVGLSDSRQELSDDPTSKP
jgi:thiamine biosynthesis lipoprotein